VTRTRAVAKTADTRSDLHGWAQGYHPPTNVRGGWGCSDRLPVSDFFTRAEIIEQKWLCVVFCAAIGPPGTLRCSAFSQYNPAELSAALGALEEYRRVDEVSVVGRVGSLIVATRGAVGPGEVLLSVRGSNEAYLAWSDQPLPRGTEVLVIDTRGARTVLVEPWIATDFTTQLP
jgi:hypothetical protein